jgi:hypothetical protein
LFALVIRSLQKLAAAIETETNNKNIERPG